MFAVPRVPAEPGVSTRSPASTCLHCLACLRSRKCLRHFQRAKVLLHCGWCRQCLECVECLSTVSVWISQSVYYGVHSVGRVESVEAFSNVDRVWAAFSGVHFLFGLPRVHSRLEGLQGMWDACSASVSKVSELSKAPRVSRVPRVSEKCPEGSDRRDCQRCPG